jgi:hypothetical protein
MFDINDLLSGFTPSFMPDEEQLATRGGSIGTMDPYNVNPAQMIQPVEHPLDRIEAILGRLRQLPDPDAQADEALAQQGIGPAIQNRTGFMGGLEKFVKVLGGLDAMFNRGERSLRDGTPLSMSNILRRHDTDADDREVYDDARQVQRQKFDGERERAKGRIMEDYGIESSFDKLGEERKKRGRDDEKFEMERREHGGRVALVGAQTDRTRAETDYIDRDRGKTDKPVETGQEVTETNTVANQGEIQAYKQKVAVLQQKRGAVAASVDDLKRQLSAAEKEPGSKNKSAFYKANPDKLGELKASLAEAERQLAAIDSEVKALGDEPKPVTNTSRSTRKVYAGEQGSQKANKIDAAEFARVKAHFDGLATVEEKKAFIDKLKKKGVDPAQINQLLGY